MATDGDIEGLLTSLRGEGEAVDTGSFALDPAKAREAMAKLAEADPHRYVVLLVQAMVQRGARAIRWEIGTREIRMTSDGRGFTVAELEDMDAQFFTPIGTAPGLRELALALTMAMASGAAQIELRCGDGSGAGARLVREAGEPERVEAIESTMIGVQLDVRLRLGTGLIGRYFATGGDATPEEVLLRGRGGLCKIAMRVDGESVPRWRFSTDAELEVPVELGGRVLGRLALLRVGGPGKLDLVRHEMLLVGHLLDGPDWTGVHTHVDGSALQTDAALADVVRDEQYDRLIAAVAEARDRAILTAASRSDWPRRGPAEPLWLLAARRLAHHMRGGLAIDAEAVRAWGDVPLWRDLDGDRVSTAELMARNEVTYCVESPGADAPRRGLPAPWCTAVWVQEDRRAAFAAVFGARARDVSAEARRADAQMARAEREASARAVGSGLPIAMAQFDVDGLSGRVSWMPLGERSSWIRIMSGTKPLVDIPVALPNIEAVLEGPLTPDTLGRDAVRDDRFADAIWMVLQTNDRVAQRVAGWAKPATEDAARVLRHLRVMQDEAAVRGLLRSTGLSGSQAVEVLSRRGRPWSIDVGRDLGPGSRHPFAIAALFAEARGGAADLCRIAQVIADCGGVSVLTEDQDPPLGFAVRTNPTGLAVLRLLFGSKVEHHG